MQMAKPLFFCKKKVEVTNTIESLSPNITTIKKGKFLLLGRKI